jgi:glycosyltransferase involved in cell wall biosynthesis
MVGGRPSQVEEYRELARALGIADRVSLVGMVHPRHIPAFLESADVIASPRSRGTNTPLKIYGYMRSRRPLVATDLYTHTQTLDADLACLVPASTEGLATGIARVLDDPGYASRLAESAYARAEGKYSDGAYIASVEKFYNAVFDHEEESPPSGTGPF